jgi:hypothetical protein
MAKMWGAQGFVVKRPAGPPEEHPLLLPPTWQATECGDRTTGSHHNPVNRGNRPSQTPSWAVYRRSPVAASHGRVHRFRATKRAIMATR